MRAGEQLVRNTTREYGRPLLNLRHRIVNSRTRIVFLQICSLYLKDPVQHRRGSKQESLRCKLYRSDSKHDRQDHDCLLAGNVCIPRNSILNLVILTGVGKFWLRAVRSWMLWARFKMPFRQYS